jgi:hypothetical protein
MIIGNSDHGRMGRDFGLVEKDGRRRCFGDMGTSVKKGIEWDVM